MLKMWIFNIYMIYRIYNCLVVKYTMHILNLVRSLLLVWDAGIVMECWDRMVLK